MKNIILPPRFKHDSIAYFIGQSISSQQDSQKTAIHERVCFDFSRLEFIEPAGVTTLNNVIHFLITEDCEVRLQLPASRYSQAVTYLDDSGFFDAFSITLNRSRSLRKTTTAIQTVQFAEFQRWTKIVLTPWLMMHTKNSRSSFNDLESAISEIFNNINDHAQCGGAATAFAQYYPKTNEIKIVIADLGVGILTTVKKQQRDIVNDLKALEWASEMSNTSNSTPRNRGVGLTHIQQCVKNLNGVVMFKSGYASMKAEDDKKAFNTEQYQYPGTYIEVILDSRNIPDIPDEEEDFEW